MSPIHRDDKIFIIYLGLDDLRAINYRLCYIIPPGVVDWHFLVLESGFVTVFCDFVVVN